MINGLFDATSISPSEKKEIIVRCRDAFRGEFSVEKTESYEHGKYGINIQSADCVIHIRP